MRFIVAILLLTVALTACNELKSGGASVPAGYDSDIYKHARELAESNIILDGHVDVPYRLLGKMEDVSRSAPEGEFDFPRAKAGGLDAPFMSIYIPAELQQTPGASKAKAEELIAMMDSIIAANPDRFATADTPAEVLANFEKGRISLPYGMENGSAMEDDLSNVEYFFNKGIRYVTLTHGKRNLICDSSYDTENQTWNGLSPFGWKVVSEMNRLGIMVDISHVSDSTFYQVCRKSKVPVICSHSGARKFTPGWERNVDDNMLKALAQNGGVIQINFGSDFLLQKANESGIKKWTHLREFMASNKIENRHDPRVEAEMDAYKSKHPYPYATVETVVDHIDHVVRVAGIDHVGLGSDFDGVGDSLPTGLKSVADYPNIVYHMLQRGYSEQDIKKVLGQNVLRVWQAATDYADKQK